MVVSNNDLMNDLQRVSGKLRQRRQARPQPPSNDQKGQGHLHKGATQDQSAKGMNKGHRYGKNTGKGAGGRGHGGHGQGNSRYGQNRILAELALKDGSSQKDLANHLGIRPQSLTQALTSLEQEGLIERKQDEGDHRTRRVHLTKKGDARAKEIVESSKSYADDTLSMLSEEEKDQLSTILEKIDASLGKEDHA